MKRKFLKIRLIGLLMVAVVMVVGCGSGGEGISAGADQTVELGTSIYLEGRPRSPDLIYTWSFQSKPVESLLRDTSFHYPGFVDWSDEPTTYFDPDVPGDYVVAMRVLSYAGLLDGEPWSNPSSVTITVTNTAPVADAGPAQSVPVDTLVTLDGSASADVNHQSVSYLWELKSSPAGSTALLTDENTIAPTITPDLVGDYTLNLIVNDGFLDSTPSILILSVSPAGTVISAGADQLAMVGETIILNGTAQVGATYAEGIWSAVSGPPGNESAFQLAYDSTTDASPLEFTATNPGSYVYSFTDGTYTDAVKIKVYPAADAGPDQDRSVYTEILLIGNANLVGLAPHWEQTAGPTVILHPTITRSSADNVIAYFTPAEIGIYVFRYSFFATEGSVTPLTTDSVTINFQ